MTKQNDINDVNYRLNSQQYENVFNVYEDSDIGYFYNLLRTINFPEDLDPDTYDIYVIESGDTWPQISWRVYSSVFLWWVICAVNQIQDPTKVPAPGIKIKILRPFYVKNLLNDVRLG